MIPGGRPGRVCRNVYPLASLLVVRYQPVRFFESSINDTSTVAEITRAPEKVERKARKSAQPVKTAARHRKSATRQITR